MIKHVLTLSRVYCIGIALAALFAYLGVSIVQSAQTMQTPGGTKIAATTHAVELADKPVRVELVSERNGGNPDIDNLIESLPASQAVYLVLTGLHADQPPGTLFHLYLDAPEGIAPKPGDLWHVGSINFYNAVPVPDAPKNAASPSFSIDITAVLRNLHSRKKLASVSTLTIMATHPPESGSKPMIGQIAIIVN